MLCIACVVHFVRYSHGSVVARWVRCRNDAGMVVVAAVAAVVVMAAVLLLLLLLLVVVVVAAMLRWRQGGENSKQLSRMSLRTPASERGAELRE
jgi:hypothetical protein